MSKSLICAQRRMKHLLTSTAIVALAMATGPSLAADAPKAAGANVAALEEVIVTGRHRAEDVQKVPVAMSVLGSQFIAETNTTSLTNLAQLVPSIQFSSINARNSNINIRGLGSIIGFAAEGIDPGVGYYVDGVYYARPGSATFDLMDVERIEVLNGPQGTLYGKNTTAGAVSVVTAAPKFETQANGEISGGNYGYLQAKGSVTGALVGDKLAGRLAVSTTWREGFFTNAFNGNKVNNFNNTSGRGQLLFQPSDTLNFRLIGDYSVQHLKQVYYEVAGIVQPSNGKNAVTLAKSFGWTPVVGQINADSIAHTYQKTGGASLEGNWTLPGAKLTSVTAYRFWTFLPENDLDQTPLPTITTNRNQIHQKQYSQELRVASEGTNRLDYVAGLFAFGERTRSDTNTTFGASGSAILVGATIPALVLNGVGQANNNRYDTDSYAAFGQATFHVDSKFSVTGGLRYTHDKRTGSYNAVAFGGLPLAGPLAAFNAVRSALASSGAFNVGTQKGNVSPHADLSYQLTDNFMTYASYSQGFRSTGLKLTVLPGSVSQTVEPETIDAYEIGFKSNLFDRRLMLNADIFLENDKNYQANVTDPNLLKTYLSNIPKVRSKGVEMNALAQPLEALTLRASVAYTDAIFVSYPGGQCGLENITLPFCNLSGRPLSGVPRWAISAGIEFHQPINLGMKGTEFYAAVDDSYRSSIYSAQTNSIYSLLPNLNLINARIGLRADSKLWDVSVWARNLEDKRFYTSVVGAAGNTGILVGQRGDPRTVGVTVRVQY